MILKHACGCEMTCGVHVELVKGIPVTRLDVCAREALYVQSCPCNASPLLHKCPFISQPNFTYHACMHLLCPCTRHSLQLQSTRLSTAGGSATAACWQPAAA